MNHSLLVLSLLLGATPAWAGPSPAAPSPLRMGFVPNVGQAPTHVRFVAPAAGGVVWVEMDGAITWLQTSAAAPVVVTQRLRGASSAVPRGGALGPTEVSLSGRGVHAAQLATFRTLVLPDAYPGISVRLRMRAGRAEQVFSLAPGADPGLVRVEVTGHLGLARAASGDLVVHTGAGPVLLAAPRADQDGRRVPVSYVVEGNMYGFALGEYDRARDLEIDPLLKAAYVGGAGDERLVQFILPTHPEHPFRGRPHVVARTTSFDLDDPNGGVKAHADVLVARLSADLRQLEQVHILGGGAHDDVNVARFHPASHALYVAGNTESTDLLPPAVTAPQPAPGGYTDGFVAVFSPDLSAISNATYMGGSGLDRITGLTMNRTLGHPAYGVVYVAGNTNSDDLPGRANGAIPTRAGILDAFVLRYAAGLSALHVSSYLGGASGSESYVSVVTDPDDGGVYLKGVTNSWMHDFPVTANAPQPRHGGRGGGSTDLFVARFGADLTVLEAATYLGGDDLEETYFEPLVVPAGSSDVYVGGTTKSSDFPAETLGARAARDALVIRMNRGLTEIYRGVAFGGSASDLLYDLQVSRGSRGDVVVVGQTGSPDLPGTDGAPQPSFGGGLGDLFVTRLSPGLHDVRRTTYLGAGGAEASAMMALDVAADELLVAGDTDSAGWALMRGGALPNHAFGRDAFVVRLAGDLSEVLGATYYGALGQDLPGGLAQHPDTREVYLAGHGGSATLPGVDDEGSLAWLGGDEVFVARFDPNLTGAGPLVPDIQVTPGACEFPNTPIGGMAEHRCIFEVRNVGRAALTLQTITSSPADAFPIEPLPAGECEPGSSLVPDEACAVVVRYLATALGAQDGLLEIVSDDPDSPVLQVALQGRGVEVVPDAGVPVDAGAPLDAGDSPDAAAPHDAGIDSGDFEDTPSCDCNHTGPAEGSLLGIGLALWLAVRRR